MKTENLPLVKIPNKLKNSLKLIFIYLFFRLIKLITLAIFSEKSLDPDSITRYVLEVILIGVLIFKIKKRKIWAKLMLLVIFVLNALSLFYSFITEVLWRDTLFISPITAILLIIVIIILNLLFNKSSNQWFNNSEKNQVSKEGKSIRKASKKKYTLLISILLSTFGFILGFIHENNLGTGTGGVEILFLLFISLILALAIIVLIFLLFRGKKKENQNLIDVSNISLCIISIPISFIIGFFISKIF